MKQENDPDELARQRLLILSSIGEEGSGYSRYSAAMYLHKQGMLSLELLEIYRRCCKFDNEDPNELARHEGIKTLCESELDIITRNQE